MPALPQYQALAELTRRMHAAALANDWDTLCRIGAERDAQIGRLPEKLTYLPESEQLKIRVLIEEILSCHTEMSERAKPWLENTRSLLSAFGGADTAPPAV